MRKYELKKADIEIKYRDRKNICPGCTQNQEELDSEIIATFTDKKTALEELEKYSSSIREMSGYFLVEEYYVEENEYDESNEWIGGGDIWEFSEMKIEVVTKPNYEVVGVFNNYADAEKAVFGYDDAYIGF